MTRKTGFWVDEIYRAKVVSESLPEIIRQLETGEATIEEITQKNIIVILKAMSDALDMAKNESDMLRRDLKELREGQRFEDWEFETFEEQDERG